MNLNPEQQGFVDHPGGAMASLAVAGSGKTQATCARIRRLVDDGQDPARILAVTFSKKAAGEMNARLRRMGVVGAEVSTWHAFARRILFSPEDNTPWYSRQIADGDGPWVSIVKEVLGYKHLDWKGADTSLVCRYVSACLAHVELPGTPEAEERARAFFYNRHQAGLAARAYAKAMDLADIAGLLTFDMMLAFAVVWLSDEENRRRWADRFDHVLVDEAQDNNHAQHELWRKLSRDHGNVCLIGDARQAIYSWRGSQWKPFFEFARAEGTFAVDMVRNYRCAPNILAAANALIRTGEVQPCPDAIAEVPALGRLEVCDAADVDDEADEVVAWLNERVTEEGARWADMVILFRVNAQTRALEDKLLRARIPYRIVGGANFYDRKMVKNLLAYLRAGFLPEAAENIARSLNAPFRYLGKAFTEKVERHWVDGEPVRAQLERGVRSERLQSRQEASVKEYIRIVEGLQRGFDEETPKEDRFKNVGEALVWLVDATKYAEWIKKEEGEESLDNSALSDVRELCRVASSFATPAELLTYVDETKEAARKQIDNRASDVVTLMTFHKSKGLEFPRVWALGWNEGTLPHARGEEPEERRLAYVAMTRAKVELVCSYVHEMALPRGVVKVEPSRYLKDAGLLVEQDQVADRVSDEDGEITTIAEVAS